GADPGGAHDVHDLGEDEADEPEFLPQARAVCLDIGDPGGRVRARCDGCHEPWVTALATGAAPKPSSMFTTPTLTIATDAVNRARCRPGRAPGLLWPAVSTAHGCGAACGALGDGRIVTPPSGASTRIAFVKRGLIPAK